MTAAYRAPVPHFALEAVQVLPRILQCSGDDNEERVQGHLVTASPLELRRHDAQDRRRLVTFANQGWCGWAADTYKEKRGQGGMLSMG